MVLVFTGKELRIFKKIFIDYKTLFVESIELINLQTNLVKTVKDSVESDATLVGYINVFICLIQANF